MEGKRLTYSGVLDLLETLEQYTIPEPIAHPIHEANREAWEAFLAEGFGDEEGV